MKTAVSDDSLSKPLIHPKEGLSDTLVVDQWDATEVAEYLQQQGIRHNRAILEQNIRGSVIPLLTSDDIRGLVISCLGETSPLGDRKLFEKAFCDLQSRHARELENTVLWKHKLKQQQRSICCLSKKRREEILLTQVALVLPDRKEVPLTDIHRASVQKERSSGVCCGLLCSCCCSCCGSDSPKDIVQLDRYRQDKIVLPFSAGKGQNAMDRIMSQVMAVQQHQAMERGSPPQECECHSDQLLLVCNCEKAPKRSGRNCGTA